MTVAVLKNRLLDLTERTFDESAYGGRTITDLVRQLPDLLVVDGSRQPPLVRILQQPATVDASEVTTGKIRSDLWSAILDYRSQTRYVWDGTTARREDRIEDREQRHSMAALPTLTEHDMDKWRTDFIAAEASLIEGDDAVAEKVEAWRHHRLGTSALPAALKPRWNRFLKQAVVARLHGWFRANAIQVPDDLIIEQQSPTKHRQPMHEFSDVEELRNLILDCVKRMTPEELRSLPLPAAAVLRERT